MLVIVISADNGMKQSIDVATEAAVVGKLIQAAESDPVLRFNVVEAF